MKYATHDCINTKLFGKLWNTDKSFVVRGMKKKLQDLIIYIIIQKNINCLGYFK